MIAAKNLWPVVLALVLTACGSAASTRSATPPVTASATVSATASASPSRSASPTPSHHGLLQVHDPGQVTGAVTGPCHTRDGGQLPDRHCTPGSYDPAITAALLCASNYRTSSYRPPESQTTTFKYADVEPAYGMSNVKGELDHLVSLELGGSNDATNLWVEAGAIPNPKDSVENALHDWVCAGGPGVAQGRLARAQVAIARNWMTAEKRLHIVSAPPPPAPVAAPSIPGVPPVACHPTTPSGNCYEPGEFCSAAEHGVTGVAGDGKVITCRGTSGGGTWHWE